MSLVTGKTIPTTWGTSSRVWPRRLSCAQTAAPARLLSPCTSLFCFAGLRSDGHGHCRARLCDRMRILSDAFDRDEEPRGDQNKDAWHISLANSEAVEWASWLELTS